MLRSFLALMAGLAATVALQAAFAAAVRRAAPSWSGASAGSAFVSLGSAFLAGAAGGFVTAWAAGANPLAHILVLAVALLVLAAFSALQARGRQPITLQIAMIALMPLGVAAGGLARLRLCGYF